MGTNRKKFSVLLLVSLACFQALRGEGLEHLTLPNDNPEVTLSQFAYGSCWKSNHSQAVWKAVSASAPQFWLWLGDNVYGDSDNMNVLRSKYAKLGETRGYRELATSIPVLAIWDDHDYGENDAGNEFVMREASQKVFMEFFNEREESPRNKRAGIYTSYYFGKADKRVQLILLDTRYFRSPLKARKDETPYKRMGKYLPDSSPEKTILGEAQWKWLENELGKPARVRIICTSIQFSAPHNGFETWANFPLEQKRMISLIKQTQAKGVVFISGDIHSSEFNLLEEEGCYPLIDHTSSSVNSGRGTNLVRRRTGPGYGKSNYGLLRIDWSLKDPLIFFETKDVRGKTHISHSVKLSELNFDKKNLTSQHSIKAYLGSWKTQFGKMLISKNKNGTWEAQCETKSKRKAILIMGENGLKGIWQDEKESGHCTFLISRDGKFLHGSFSQGDLPLQLDWAGWRK